MSWICSELNDEFGPLSFSEDPHSMKSKREIILTTLEILGSKVDPAMLVQLRSWCLLDPSARFFYILVIK